MLQGLEHFSRGVVELQTAKPDILGYVIAVLV
jgi:hypothetical protein